MAKVKRRAGVAHVLTALTIAGALVASGCGLGGERPSEQAASERAEAGSIKPVDELKGEQIKVGSKDFTEQLVLGQMSIAVLEAAGAKPVDKTKITGTASARKALVGGSIDTYWEYLGTGWTELLGHDERISDIDELAKKVSAEDLQKNKISWLSPSPLVNTYAIAMSEETAKRLKINKLSDLKSLPKSDLTFCVGTEFFGRPTDGFNPMLKAYGINPSSIPGDNVNKMGDAVVYNEVSKGDNCNFASTFSSDGRVPANDLTLLEDDKKFFPLYNAAVNVRQEVLKKYPELKKVFKPVSDKLTTEEMQKLNAEVDIDGKTPRVVAREWLKKQGFIG